MDTGAEFSIINTNLCHPNWKTNVNVSVKAMGNIIKINTLCRFPCFNEFNMENYFCEFLEYEFHSHFDGLIGGNILNDLKANISYSKNELQLNDTVLKLYLHDSLPKSLPEIRTNHLDIKSKNLLNSVLNEYKSLFYNDGQDLSFIHGIKHKIPTRNEKPIYSRAYRYAEIHKAEINKQINEMLKQKIIRNSISPYNSPMLVVQKKLNASNKQKWRLVVDYKKLNNETIEDRFPIPHIDDIFDKLSGCKIFTILDLAKGFYQIEMDEKDIPKTAFSTANGHYEFLRMPFGLQNAPATFQRLMNNLLRPYIGFFCHVYMDDILIFSKHIEEHVEHLTTILNCLKNANVKLQIDKCEFAKDELEFLGHTINSEGLKPNKKKVEAIDRIQLPTSQKQIQSFLGMTNYLRRFIKDYASVSKHLNKYLKSNSKVNINDVEYIEAFNKLKELIKNEPVVVYPNFNKKFTLTTDASNYALGAVLMQENRVICYASRVLKDSELNYSTIEKELLAIHWATHYFKYYLYGRKFTIKTDHRPLVWLNNLKEPNLKLQRWKIQLNEFDFDIEFIKGKENCLADGLSRIVEKSKDSLTDEEKTLNLEDSDIFILELNKGPTELQINELEDFSGELLYLFNSQVDELQTIHSAESDDHDFIKLTECSLNVYKIQMVIKESIAESHRAKILYKNKIRHIIKTNGNEETMLKFIREIFPEKGLIAVYCEKDYLFNKFQNVYRQYFVNNKNLKILKTCLLLKDIIDTEELLKIIECQHLENNHRGINEVFLEIKRRYYYPKLKHQIQKYINNCKICNLAKFDRNPVKYNLNITETPSKHNDIIHIDIWYPQKGIMYLTTIDKLTKYATVHNIKDRTWISLLNAIKHRIQNLGKPNKIIADNEFDIISIKQFLNENEIDLYLTTPNHKTGNSDVERLHQTLNEHIRLFKADPNNEDIIHDKVFKSILYYNNT